MKRMLWMLPLLFAGMTAAAQNQDMARLGTYMDNGEFVVGTAETVLAADITVRCEKIVCGPYARYAQKFLGLRAPLTDKTVYTVADAAIALMPGERYVTAGELPASTCRVESYEAQGADFARLQTDRLDMTEPDLQTAARNAAAAILSQSYGIVRYSAHFWSTAITRGRIVAPHSGSIPSATASP